MARQVSKEQVVFLIAAALFLWVMAKLLLFLTHRGPQPGTALTEAAPPQPAEASITDLLAPRSLESYLSRRNRPDPFSPDVTQPAKLFVRSLVRHSFLRSSLVSRYEYECSMSPRPLAEMRFQLPANLKITAVFSNELAPDRKWGQDGRTLIVPVNPTLVKRTFYRTSITIVAEAPFSAPALWTAPALSCTEGTRPEDASVLCEIGHIAISTPGEHVELAPKEGAATGLTRITLESVPPKLAAQSNKLAYVFRKPDYQLVIEVKAKETAVTRVPSPKGGPVLSPTKEPVVGPIKEPVIPEPKEEKPKLDIPTVGDADTLPFKLAAIVELREPEPRRQAVLRNKDSGEYLRKFEGESFMNDFRVVAITDDAVVIADSSGKRYRFPGRFDEHYNTAPTTQPAPKQGPPARKGG